ncbi:thiol:disulfide interchange protein DsbD [Bacteroidales bacterium WCE2004]|nr:thiol:disulfide interchange protein DsbD [Bacteroidales bacterium WCE2004]
MIPQLFIALALLLQAVPQVNWKSEVRQDADGSRIVLTGELEEGIDHISGTVTYMPCKGDACYMPVDWDFEEFLEETSADGAVVPGNVSLRETPPTAESGGPLPLTKPRVATVSRADTPSAGDSNSSLWALILEAILWGFAMLLTPCVFPMVPMTVSFFMKGSDNARQGRLKAALYGLFIVLLYTVPICLIIGITWIVGGSTVTADIFNWLSTHWLPNILFFLVFMVFAASFFGAFEITLPSKWTNGADKNSDRKGLGGIFFLALTLVLVSFSCTGPIVGTVLIKSTQGEFWAPMVTMLAFSVAFALPFTVLALFPSLLKKLPRGGGWLNSVKVVLGFVEVALGLKFLSTADQTYHWHLLDREVYLAIWIAVFTLLGLYLIGKIRFKNDSPLEYIGVPRLALAIAVFSFVVYLIPGMWGAPLKALSGYLPPMETQDFVLGASARAPIQISDAAPGNMIIAHDLAAYDNLPDALAAAKATGKPVFLDFTGYGCVNCREMEARVWSDPEVLRRLRNNFVIAALHVDDKTKLPEEKWVLNEHGKPLKDVGRVNSYIALHDFGVNAQPNYFLLDSDGNRLAGPRPYNLDVQGFIEFLDAAL